MARIKCVMMQRDETQLLEPWLRYHGYLFGYENLVVLDHGSREPSVQAVLRRFAAAGVVVRLLDAEQFPFTERAALIEATIRTLDTGPPYDFALPLDCDEFVALLHDGGVSTSRSAIHAAFESLVGERRALTVEMSFNNATGRPGWFESGGAQKGFLPACSILDIDQGFHAPRSRLANGSRLTQFCHLHFRHKPFAVTMEHARRKLELRVDCNDRRALEDYRGDGSHLVRYLLMTPEEYDSISDAYLIFSAPQFDRLADALGIDAMLYPEPHDLRDDTIRIKLPGRRIEAFDPEAYLKVNPDVRDAGVDPFYHYLRYGWQEQRTLA